MLKRIICSLNNSVTNYNIVNNLNNIILPSKKIQYCNSRFEETVSNSISLERFLEETNITYNIDNLEVYQGRASIFVENVKFETVLIPSCTNNLYVSLTSGPRNRKVRFVRWKYASLLDGYYLGIDDPMFSMFQIPKDLMGWFYGTDNDNYLDKLSVLIMKIASILHIPYCNVTIIGSSSGGYAATYVCNKIRDCSIISINPQLVLSKWPFAKKLSKITGIDFNKNDPRNYIQIDNMTGVYFFYFNLKSKHDIPQLLYLLDQLSFNPSDLKLGINKVSNNVLICINSLEFYNTHLTSPEDIEIVYIKYLINLFRDGIDIDSVKPISQLLLHSMNKRYELSNKIYDINNEHVIIEKKYNNIVKFLYKIESDYWTQRNYLQTLLTFREIFSNMLFSTGWACFTHTRTAISKVNYSSSQQIEYWNSLSNSNMILAKDIAVELKSEVFDIDKISTKFEKLLFSLFKSSETISTLKQSFSILIVALSGKQNCEFPKPLSDHRDHIFVSGFAASSGSSALFDYFKEFSCIYPISGEFSIIESNGAFAGIARNIGKPTSILKLVVDFFFRNLLGCYEISKAQDFKDMFIVNRFAKNNNYNKNFLESILKISFALANVIFCIKNNANNIKDFINDLGVTILNHICINVPKDKVPLIDNSIHVHNIDLVNYFSNIRLACVCRDPRCTYANRIANETAFILSPKEFSVSYLKFVDRVKSNIKKIDKNCLVNKIVLVNYESLIISENYRDFILSKFNISKSSWKCQHEFFKPEESYKNVISYTIFDNQAAIQEVYQNLSQFCIDYTMIPKYDNSPEDIYFVGTNCLFKEL